MMRSLIRVSVITSLVLLAACAKPTTARPNLDKGAVAQETQVQKGIAGQTGQVIKPSEKETYDASTLSGMNGRLQAMGGRITDAGRQLCQVTGRNPNSCTYSFVIKPDNVLNAYADGQKIYVTPVMMRFASDDDTLAMVLSHEYAHNVMGHVASKQQNMAAGMILGTALDVLAKSRGMDTGGKLGNFGASTGANAYSPSFESEADYVGLYIMDYAGYNISNAAGLWRRMTAADSKSAFITTTHPANPERYVLLNQTRDEIMNKKKSGQPLVPNMKVE